MQISSPIATIRTPAGSPGTDASSEDLFVPIPSAVNTIEFLNPWKYTMSCPDLRVFMLRASPYYNEPLLPEIERVYRPRSNSL